MAMADDKTYRISYADIRAAKMMLLYEQATAKKPTALERAIGTFNVDDRIIQKECYGQVIAAARSYQKQKRSIDSTLADLGRIERTSVVVNLIGGPGAGKTTAALEIAAELKKDGYTAAYIPEYATELIADGQADLLDGTAKHQREVFSEQLKRQRRYEGFVDFVVTDSPPLLSAVYGKEVDDAFKSEALASYKEQTNFALFIERGHSYSSVGRLHSKEEAILIDRQLKDFLKDNNIYYGTYTHQGIQKAIENMERTFENKNRWTQITCESTNVGEASALESALDELGAEASSATDSLNNHDRDNTKHSKRVDGPAPIGLRSC